MNDSGQTAVRATMNPALPQPQVSEFSIAGDAFLLDIDGTLLDIAPTPESVHVPAALKATLAILQRATNGALALVSGRPLSSIDQLFAPLSLVAIGCHGAEWRKRVGEDAELRATPLTAAMRNGLVETVSDLSGVLVEDKGYTLAFHYRRAPEHRTALQQRLAARVATFGSQLCVLHGKAVFEVKPCSFDKGEAIAALMHAPPFAGRRPIFTGDDHTDEFALAVIRKMGGIGISVGRKLSGADRMLPAPYAVRSWLAHLVQSSA